MARHFQEFAIARQSHRQSHRIVSDHGMRLTCNGITEHSISDARGPIHAQTQFLHAHAARCKPSQRCGARTHASSASITLLRQEVLARLLLLVFVVLDVIGPGSAYMLLVSRTRK